MTKIGLVSSIPQKEVLLPGELDDMHRYCKAYRDRVRAGETPTKDQDDKFIKYSDICYKTGKWREI